MSETWIVVFKIPFKLYVYVVQDHKSKWIKPLFSDYSLKIIPFNRRSDKTTKEFY